MSGPHLISENIIDLSATAAIITEALQKSDEWLVITDENGDVLFCNDFVCYISGYKKEELLGGNPRVFKSGYQDKTFYEKLWKTISDNLIFSGVLANRKKNGELFYVQMKIIPVESMEGKRRYVSIGRDITKEVELTSEIEEIKFHDLLTGLMNFNAFSFKVSEIIEFEEELSMLVLIDIHNLTYINQVFGLAAGDRLLQLAGQVLLDSFKNADIVAKIGGDEFGLFLRNIKKKEDSFIIRDRISDAFKVPVVIDGKEILVGINAGVVLFPDDGKDFKVLYERASAALSDSKKHGVGDIRFFNSAMEENAKVFLKTENIVDKAIKEKLFIFYYQPYFLTNDLNQIGGFECLARIRQKDGTILGPSSFIDYLENSYHLEQFEEFALESAVEKILEMNINLSVNISAKSFIRGDYIKKILSACYRVGSRLTIEITERVLSDDITRTKMLLSELKMCKHEHGEQGFCENPIKIAMDDFGTGYSSLFCIKDLPINIIKIDISFVRDMTKGPRELALVKVIIELARELGLKTVAEGVETKEQLEILKELNCDFVQGFLLAKPMPEENLSDFMSNHKILRAAY